MEQVTGNDNAVELIGSYGGDVTHACSAWTSTDRDLDVRDAKTGKTKRERIPELLHMLAHRDDSNWREPKHSSPFEKSALHFWLDTEKASHIHIIKHRVAVSVNGESARYKELKEDRWYYPNDWPTEEECATDGFAFTIRQRYLALMDATHAGYHALLRDFQAWKRDKLVRGGVEPELALRKARKRAKESARFVLPHASQIEQDVQFNFLSFMHFCDLRASDHAQREVQEIALRMLVLTWTIKDSWGNAAFAHSLDAFDYALERVLARCADFDPALHAWARQTIAAARFGTAP